MNTKSKLLSLGATLALLLTLGYIWATYTRWTGGMENQRPPTVAAAERPEFGRGEWRQDRLDRQERFQQLARELNLTEEQQEQIRAVREENAGSGEGPGAMFAAMQHILTPEQREAAREHFESRRSEFQQRMSQRMAEREREARETLSPQDFEVWKQKMEERRARFAGRFGGGDGQQRDGLRRGGTN